MTVKDISKLVAEYRPSMDKEVLHSWAGDVVAALTTPPVQAVCVPVAHQWRSRIKGGPWDAWENGRYGQQVPPFMEVEERALYAAPALPDAGLKAENEELKAALDQREIESGLTRNGNLWRFWAAKAREMAQKNKDAYTEISNLRVALKSALQFMVNGIETGFIWLPDDKSDPAHQTIPMIDAALKKDQANG